MTTTLMYASEPGAVRSQVSQVATKSAILLATDGSAGSADAVVLAMALARRRELPLQILTVVEPLPLRLDDDLASVPFVDVTQRREDEAHHRVRRQICDLSGREEPVGINVEFGKTAQVIGRLARQWQARLVVLGRGPREQGGQEGRGATARSVASEVPVATLAVAVGRGRLPKVIVVGMDFSDVGIAASRTAVAIADHNAVIHLILVRPVIDFPRVDTEAWATLYEQGVHSLFEKLARELRELGGAIDVQITMASGAVADVLRQAAISTSADVIAVGRHGHNRFDRLWMGSVTEALLRDAPCSVLVAPAPAGSA